MTGSRRLLLAALVLAAAFLVVPAAANAANRYASPTGVGADPCSDSSAPCPIDVAVNKATTGDDVTLLGGVPPAAPFTSSVSLGLVCNPGCSIINGITVHGAPGARPVVNFDTTPE